ncbi:MULTISPECIES: LytTR family DNA-binding domain-containing protein [unclassified Brevundimonas]|uniref:LytTR family DNA-binding domain-containing protein n=1 Tax=unclassified Brevundimonas TaxID=2622653 RepID=UPI0025C6F28B|nr:MULTISPECIES: LytTR family DNA-binding domain-containing protein [unclassified Brevundimonas]
MDSWGLKDRRWRAAAVGFAVSTAVGLALGIIGPFGSYLSGTLPVRTAYWVVCLWAGWLAFGVSLPILARWAEARRISAWIWTPPAVAVLTLLPVSLSRTLAVRLWPVVGQVGWLEWYGQGLVISALATVGMMWATRSREATATKSDAESADPRDRLPAKLGRTVLCLQMEDHYVRVHTPQGSALVLMSLSQAMAGLKDVDGTQTHRSWWVARAGVVGVVEDGRNTRLRLTGGLEAPVSRARVGALREEGWLT